MHFFPYTDLSLIQATKSSTYSKTWNNLGFQSPDKFWKASWKAKAYRKLPSWLKAQKMRARSSSTMKALSAFFRWNGCSWSNLQRSVTINSQKLGKFVFWIRVPCLQSKALLRALRLKCHLKKYRECWDLYLRLLGEKRERYNCAIV